MWIILNNLPIQLNHVDRLRISDLKNFLASSNLSNKSARSIGIHPSLNMPEFCPAESVCNLLQEFPAETLETAWVVRCGDDDVTGIEQPFESRPRLANAHSERLWNEAYYS